MFQSGKRREKADEKHICDMCSKKNECELNQLDWRYILTYCARFEKEGD